MKLEFLIPASPNAGFFSQIAMFRRGLDYLGGDYAAARLVAVFGAEVVSPIPEEWRHHLERVEIHWVEPQHFRARGYLATGNLRFDLISPAADISIICDADTLLVRPFGADLLALIGREAVAGVIAHYHFPWEGSQGQPQRDWQSVAQAALNHPIALSHAYTLAGTGEPEAPFYINFGFVAGTPSGLTKLWSEMKRIETRVESILGNYFSSQVSFALAAAKSCVSTFPLPMRYNFANDARAESFYPDELRQAILLHYLRGDVFDRQRIFTSPAAYEEFMAMPLQGANALLREHVRLVAGSAFPFHDAARTLDVSAE